MKYFMSQIPFSPLHETLFLSSLISFSLLHFSFSILHFSYSSTAKITLVPEYCFISLHPLVFASPPSATRAYFFYFFCSKSLILSGLSLCRYPSLTLSLFFLISHRLALQVKVSSFHLLTRIFRAALYVHYTSTFATTAPSSKMISMNC